MDDFSMPELVSPSPQRSAPEEFHEIQDKLQHMELGANSMRPGSVQSSAYSVADSSRGGAPQGAGRPAHSASRQGSNAGGGGYDLAYDAPSFSPFPKLSPRPPNVPPSDEEKLQILETARPKVIASNDPEIQLTWAQDTLNFVEIAAQDESRNAMDNPRPPTPRLEHELKEEAVAITRFLAEQGHPRAQFIRGMWLEFGKFGTRKDLRESYRCYARSAERGYARSEYRMGMQFEGSNDVNKAVQHYNIGVGRHDAASSYRIGMMTLLGQHGQTLNIDRGLELIKFSAENADENSPQGAYIYGMLLARELPQVSIPDYTLSFDQNKARTYIEKAAFLGFAKAQTKLGKAYEHSELGCRFDAVLSLHYNNLAARQGDEDAEMAISKWFLSGQEGVFSKNEQMAYKYAQRAARSGLATAEFAMGYFHEVGIHVPVDLKEAQRWYRKAADNGNKDAAARVEGISRSKTLSRKDHDRYAVAKVKEARADDQGPPPRGSSRASGPNGAPLQMPQPASVPANGYPGQYGQAGGPVQSGNAGYQTGPNAGYRQQQGGYQGQGPPGAYNQSGYGGAPGGRPGPVPGGYSSPAPGQQGPGGRGYAGNPHPPRTTSTPQPNRRPVGGGPSPAPPADFGFSAPQSDYRPRPDYSAGGQYPQPTSRPDYPSQPGSPVSGVPPSHRQTASGGRPSPAPSGPGGPGQRPPNRQASGQYPQRQPTLPQGPQPQQPQQKQQQPQQLPQQQQQQQQAPRPQPAQKKPVIQGPSTFDEMGVPKVKDKDECIVM